uniref:Heat shock factor protein 5 n=1 Tax=Oncorhynchus kisutch TaxID=8019 RepID=A0A8C7IEP4_ONCKI
MELEEERLTIPINPNNFPAKLWRLVNNPKNRSIRWDPCGEGLIIDQQLFESELLSPQKQTFDTTDLFKTTNFTSFNRQLNLYGFRKVVHGPGASEKNDVSSPMDGIKHHFHNPNFKQDHPELLVNLKRLTSKNKAKMEAGLEVNCRPPANRFHRLMANGDGGEERVKVDKRAMILMILLSFNPMKDYDRTPIPPRGWIMGHGDAPSPTTFYTDKGIPISVIHRFPSDTSCTVQSSPTTVHIQQGSQSLANSLIPHHAQYRPGFYSPGNYNKPYHGSTHYETQETKKSDVNLDTVFQLVDELHHNSPKIRMVKVETPERQQPVLSTSTSSGPQPITTIHSSPHTVTVSSQLDSSFNSSPVTSRGPIIIAVPGNVPPQGITSAVFYMMLLSAASAWRTSTRQQTKSPGKTTIHLNFCIILAAAILARSPL